MRDLLRHTPPEHPDQEGIQKALSMLQSVAAGVNENVRQAEKARDFNAINAGGTLQFLVAPHRHLVHEGEMVNADRQKKQFLILFNDKVYLVTRYSLADSSGIYTN